MYKRILAPLDGSEFSECLLPHLRAIALGCQVPAVVLLRVIEPLPPLAKVTQPWLREVAEKEQAEAKDYLSKLAAELKNEGIAAETVVMIGQPDEEILNFAQRNEADLIIMSTHGRSGATRWLLGGVTDRVVRHSPVAVLTVAPAGCRRD